MMEIIRACKNCEYGSLHTANVNKCWENCKRIEKYVLTKDEYYLMVTKINEYDKKIDKVLEILNEISEKVGE